MSQTKITGVPNARVPALKRSFERAGATQVEVVDNGDSTSDVTATFPDQQAHSDVTERLASG